jgi:predicted DsbA family dithiol-disulfide isomerase
MLFKEILYTWLGYLLLRGTIIVKEAEYLASHHPIWLTRLTGIILILLALFQKIISEYRNISLSVILCLLILSSYLDLTRFKKLGVSMSKKPEARKSLMTWDMWLVTTISILSLIYYAIYPI